MTTINEHCVRICNSLLRGEISAGEAYGFAIERFPADPALDELRRIRTEHAQSAALLAANVREMGGEPEKDSGAWGIFTAVVQGTADLFGADSAIDSLRKGEEMGRSDYQDALLDDDVMPACKNLIRDELLPSVIQHIAALEKLEKPD
jgi:hypothetical protein